MTDFFYETLKKRQWALHVYSIATFVASWLKWLQMILNARFKGSISIFSRTCIFTKYFQVFHYKVLYVCITYRYVLYVHCTYIVPMPWNGSCLKKRKKKYSRKELTPLCNQYMYIHSTPKNLQSTYINFFRSLLEDLEHQSRWREVDYLDDTAEGDPNFLTPYRLVSLKVS